MPPDGPTLKVDELLALELPADADQVAGLPLPADTELDQASKSHLAEGVVHFRKQLAWLVGNDLWEFANDRLHIESDVGVSTCGFWSVVNVLGTYYGYCAYRFAEMAQPLEVAHLLRESKLKSPSEEPAEESAQEIRIRLHVVSAVALFASHDVALLGLLEAAAIDAMGFQPGEFTEAYDADLIASEALSELFSSLTEQSGESRQMLEQLLEFALRYRIEMVRRRGDLLRREAQENLAGVSLLELALLAVRDQIVTERYGEKRVEQIFEQKLALIFQSFGFMVVPARPGESRADLICISRSERFSFLVDAKSSRGRYALPKTDQRAIKDYVADFSTDLLDLPPLAFVLIVGGSIAGTVPAKLKALEIEIGVPIKFMPAATVARLRQAIPGPVLPKQFRESVAQADPEVDQSLIDAAKNEMERLTTTYSSFVEGLKRTSTP